MILIYGLRRGETERYTEELLSSQCISDAEVEAMKARCARDGWHSFRVTTFKEGTKPNFGGTINK